MVLGSSQRRRSGIGCVPTGRIHVSALPALRTEGGAGESPIIEARYICLDLKYLTHAGGALSPRAGVSLL